MKNYYMILSEEILSIAKSGGDSTLLRRQLFYIRQAKLENSLVTDDLKKAFWINIYYAFYLINNKDVRDYSKMHALKRIKIARSILSLNDIEHGILRKTKLKSGFGYLPNPFYSKFIKKLAVDELDYRIHFALQSIFLGSVPIDYYESEAVDLQLQETTKIFIKLETHCDSEQKLIRTSKFLFSYLRDFGGIKAIKKLLEQNLKRDFKGYTLQFKNT